MIKPNIAVIVSTHNRVDDARINMEIIRNIWGGSGLFGDITIIHVFNGKKEWWPQKYLEDEIIRLKNRGHFKGAVDLMEAGFKHIHDYCPDITYAAHFSADTWLTKPEYLASVIHTMEQDNLYLSTCAWGSPTDNNMWKIGMALDMFVINVHWAMKYKFFPLRYDEFYEKYAEFIYYLGTNTYPDRLLPLRFLQALRREDPRLEDNAQRAVAETKILRMTDREPVHNQRRVHGKKVGYRKMFFPSIGLITHHEPEEKQKLLRKLSTNHGPNTQKLISSKDLSYFNIGQRKNHNLTEE